MVVSWKADVVNDGFLEEEVPAALGNLIRDQKYTVVNAILLFPSLIMGRDQLVLRNVPNQEGSWNVTYLVGTETGT